jgi:Uncharacterized protein conserved in archaea
MRLLICSTSDIASVNIRDCLFKLNKWDGIGSDGKNEFHRFGNDVVMSIPDLHIYAEDIDSEAKAFGIDFDEVVFMSRHKAASAIPTLTVHPIGNFNNADFGGRSKELVRTAAASMTNALREMSKMDTGEFKTSFEVTHHGPWLETPTYFIEIGSDETMWGNMHAAEMLAHVISVNSENDFPTAVGIGGGHYAPRFSEIANAYRINFGHMVPNYALEGSDDNEAVRMISSALEASETKLVYMHKKSMKKPYAAHLTELIETEGFEIISSKDLDSL